MKEDELEEKYQIQTRELYALLGEFLVNFQLFCFAMRNGIQVMANTGGSTIGHALESLTAELTAYPMLRAFHSIAMGKPNITNEEKAVLSKIYDRAEKLIEDRNKFIHGTWFIGGRNDNMEDFSTAEGFKQRLGKQGVVNYPLTISSESFQPLIYECVHVYRLVQRASCIYISEIDFVGSFHFSDDSAILANDKFSVKAAQDPA